MQPNAAELGLLTAMITPAVLISATGMLILSTSNRLARIVEQTRTLGAAMEQLSNGTRPARRITTPPPRSHSTRAEGACSRPR